MKKLLYKFLIFTLLISCGSDDSIFLDYKNMTNGWEYDNPVEFSFDSPAEAVNISIMLRTDKSYPFSNIFIKSQIVSEDNQIVDTIELDLKQEKELYLVAIVYR